MYICLHIYIYKCFHKYIQRIYIPCMYVWDIQSSIPHIHTQSHSTQHTHIYVCIYVCECVCVCVCMCMRAKLLHSYLTLQPYGLQPMKLLSMEFSRQEYWSELPHPPPGDLPYPGIKPMSLMSPALQVASLPVVPLGKPIYASTHIFFSMFPYILGLNSFFSL